MEVIDVVVVGEVEEPLLQVEIEFVEVFGIHEHGCVHARSESVLPLMHSSRRIIPNLTQIMT